MRSQGGSKRGPEGYGRHWPRKRPTKFHVLRTDRRTGREECKAHVNKKTWLLHEKKLLVTKCEVQQNACQNMLPEASKTLPGTSPNPLKSRPREAQGAKMVPRSGPNQPRNAQERPPIAQEASNKRPREVKSRPRAPKSRRSGAQERPKRGPDASKI